MEKLIQFVSEGTWFLGLKVQNTDQRGTQVSALVVEAGKSELASHHEVSTSPWLVKTPTPVAQEFAGDTYTAAKLASKNFDLAERKHVCAPRLVGGRFYNLVVVADAMCVAEWRDTTLVDWFVITHDTMEYLLLSAAGKNVFVIGLVGMRWEHAMPELAW